MLAATAALSDSARPLMGMVIRCSQAAMVSGFKPFPLVPTATAAFWGKVIRVTGVASSCRDGRAGQKAVGAQRADEAGQVLRRQTGQAENAPHAAAQHLGTVDVTAAAGQRHGRKAQRLGRPQNGAEV